MILTDAGALVALLDTDDRHHSVAIAQINDLPAEPMLTTWPCFTEAMHLLGSVSGWHYQSQLWALRTTGPLLLHDLTSGEIARCAALMEQYRNVPMDLADASLVAVAESRELRQIFTFDSDFRIYRLQGGSVLQMIP